MRIVPEKVVSSRIAPPPLPAVPRSARFRRPLCPPDIVTGMSVLIDPLNELASTWNPAPAGTARRMFPEWEVNS